MTRFLTSNIGRLRLLGFLEGTSLLLLLFVAMPLKYIWDMPEFTKHIGAAHGALFLLFIINTLSVGIEYRWSFFRTTWKVLLACVLPFGTFYIDHHILQPLHE